MSDNGWDEEADVIVVGYGAAGACAAITAADRGLRVMVLEKQPRAWHTPSTRASGGQVMAVDDVDKATRYFDRCAGGMIPLPVSRAWAERASTVVAWLGEVAGLDLVRVAGAEHPGWDGSDAIAAYGPRESYPYGERTAERVASMPPDERAQAQRRRGGGAVLFAALERAVEQRASIAIRYETSAMRLLQDGDRRVIGVSARSADGPRRYHARRGVILTCGGYEYDEEMKSSYLRAPAYFYASPMNTGDGVRMAQALGADLWHMNQMVGRAVAHFELDGIEHTFSVGVTRDGYALLDKYGNRFTNEQMQVRHDFYYELIMFDAAKSEHPRIPCYWFFDSRRMSSGPIVVGSGAAGPRRYDWSPDSREEIARGWIAVGQTLEEVAARSGVVDPAQAVRSLREYNDACRTGEDRFGRSSASLVPLDRPPYYCLPLWPGGPNTSGGPRRNERAQVIDVFGEPMPGLYEAGELGEAIGALYPANGANLSDALCFGRIAAEEIVAASEAHHAGAVGAR